MDSSFRLVRVVRTLSSEIYVVWNGEQRVGQVDLHYAQQHPQPLVHATIVLEAPLSSIEEEGLVDQVDDELASSYLPHFDRQDLLVTVFRGAETNQYNDSRNSAEPLG